MKEPSTEPTPTDSALSTVDQAARWFWSFLKAELAPFPGRSWVVVRMIIAATIVMLLVMTFRLPDGALAVIFTLLLSRENPTETFRGGVRIILSFATATAWTLIGVALLVDNPITHFLWIAGTLFVAFYLIRVIPDYRTAVGFGFMIAGAIPLWDQTQLSTNVRVENTLWLAFSVAVGSVVTIAVEYVFRRVHPTTDLTQGIDNRLQVVEEVLASLAGGSPLSVESRKNISLFSDLGTSRLRRLIFRSGYSSHFIAQMNAAIALLGRLVDLAASLQIFSAARSIAITDSDRRRCRHLADEIVILRQDLKQRSVPRALNLPDQASPSDLPFLSAMESAAAHIPEAFAGTDKLDEFIPAPMDEEVTQHLFQPDAFTNPAHLQFAIRGTLAALACYVIYTAIDWSGLSTCISTCVITALSTIGSSRQKQFLRLAGAIVGGVGFGMGAQIFVLPYLDSIAGFTILFVVVTAISAWIATATPRLSYLGVQLALAFYLINMQEFTIQVSLAVARDRVFGVLLGLISMWLVFDRLWVRNALDEIETVFAQTLAMFAELSEQLQRDDQQAVVKRIRQLRERINANFQTLNAQADAVLFEFGAARRRKLRVRNDLRRWLPSLRTLVLVQITSSQYRLRTPLKDLPQAIADAHVAFERDVARVMRALADEVSGRVPEAPPNIQESATSLRQNISAYYKEQGWPISPQLSDVFRLAETLASLLAPLYEDIHSTFSNIGAEPDEPQLRRTVSSQLPGLT